MNLFYSPFAIPIVAILAVFTCSLVSLITSSVRSIVKHRNEVELKQSMIDRGMSADEIERVIRASSPASEKIKD